MIGLCYVCGRNPTLKHQICYHHLKKLPPWRKAGPTAQPAFTSEEIGHNGCHTARILQYYRMIQYNYCNILSYINIEYDRYNMEAPVP